MFINNQGKKDYKKNYEYIKFREHLWNVFLYLFYVAYTVKIIIDNIILLKQIHNDFKG